VNENYYVTHAEVLNPSLIIMNELLNLFKTDYFVIKLEVCKFTFSPLKTQMNAFLWTRTTPAMFSPKKYTFAFWFLCPAYWNLRWIVL